MTGTRMYARGAQMETLIAQMGGAPAEHPVHSKYVTAEQMDRLIATMSGGGGGDNVAPVIADSTSGDVASFSDGAEGKSLKSLIVGIEPVQDLHGYESPWPGGGGKNLFDEDAANWKFNYIIDNNGDVTQSGSYKCCEAYTPVLASTQYAIQMNKTTTLSRAMSVCEYDSSYQMVARTVVVSPDTSTGVESGTFTTTSSTVYVRINAPYDSDSHNGSYQFQLEVSSSATAWTPYSNICPISGWTGTEVTRTGKTLCDISEFVLGTFKNDGTEAASTTRLRSPFVRVNGGSTVAYASNLILNEIYYYDKNKQYVGKNAPYETAYTKELPANAAYTRFSVRKSDNSTVTLSDLTSVMVAYGTDTTVEPYQGTIIPISWQSEAGTVYGGTLTLNEDGSADLTSEYKSVDLGTLTWTTAGSGRHNTTLSDAYYNQQARDEDIYALCSQYTQCNYNSIANRDMHFFIGINNVPTMQINDSRYNNEDASDFKAHMSGVQIVYTLATPTTYHFDSIGELTTLLGQNNIWATSGPVSLEYRADTKSYIDKKLAELMAQIVNS